HLDGIVKTTGLVVDRAERQIGLGPAGVCADDLLQFLHRVRRLTKIEEREAKVIVAFEKRRIRLQCLTQKFGGLSRVLQLTLGFTERRHELRVPWSLLERGF